LAVVRLHHERMNLGIDPKVDSAFQQFFAM
jgi:hypothetical protein